MKPFLVTIVLFICGLSLRAQQGDCEVKFSPEAVKPGALESVRAVFASFSPPAESKRLSDLRKVVLELKDKKDTLADTLGLVLGTNSLQEWQKARLQEIPALQNRIVALFRMMYAEYEEGGLFAGNEAFRDLRVVVNEKTKQMGETCYLTHATLPLTNENKAKLGQLIMAIRAEVMTLTKIDDQLVPIIEKAQEKEEKKKSG